jgi:hypothetical protein
MIAPDKAKKQQARAARLSAALRENLKRRKAQTRGRTGQRENDEQLTVPATPDFRRNRGSV